MPVFHKQLLLLQCKHQVSYNKFKIQLYPQPYKMSLDYKNKKVVSFELTENRAYEHDDGT